MEARLVARGSDLEARVAIRDGDVEARVDVALWLRRL